MQLSTVYAVYSWSFVYDRWKQMSGMSFLSSNLLFFIFVSFFMGLFLSILTNSTPNLSSWTRRTSRSSDDRALLALSFFFVLDKCNSERQCSTRRRRQSDLERTNLYVSWSFNRTKDNRVFFVLVVFRVFSSSWKQTGTGTYYRPQFFSSV